MENGGISKMSKAEIDTSPPFRSVKEAVLLFGEGVVTPQPKTDRISSHTDDELATVISELEETKRSLRQEREQSIQMAQSLSSLQQQLQQTKTELHHFKTRQPLDFEIEEDFKYVECSSELIFEQVKKETFANNRSVSVAQVVVPPPPTAAAEAVLQRHGSVKKKKKKQFIPFIGGIWGKKKGSSEF